MNPLEKLSRQSSHTVSSATSLLIIDDDETIRNMLKTIFSRLGYRLITAENGQEGLDLFRQHQSKIELVLLDWKMPVMDGKATFEQIRKIDADQKVVMMSGYSNQEELEDILQGRRVGFINKPFTIDEIVSRVEQMVHENG